MAQLTLQRLREFGIAPDTSLGQHFLIDDNMLDVIGELASLEPGDVVYEPGAGVGILTRYLAQRVKHVHAVEIDRRLEPALSESLDDTTNVSVHWGDAVALDAAGMQPAPNRLVSNLPYHVGTPIVAETLQRAAHVTGYCVMVQREVAGRFFAAPGSSEYGGLSVLVQTLCRRTGSHRVSRQVFAPPPNVDSMLLAFERTGEHALADASAYGAFVRSCFAHRRKTLANNLAAANFGRAGIETVCRAAGVRPGDRPQQLSPPQFVELFTASRQLQ